MKQPLFDHNDRYTPEADDIERVVSDLLRGIFPFYASKHSVRELEYLIHRVATDLALEHLTGSTRSAQKPLEALVKPLQRAPINPYEPHAPYGQHSANECDDPTCSHY